MEMDMVRALAKLLPGLLGIGGLGMPSTLIQTVSRVNAEKLG